MTKTASVIIPSLTGGERLIELVERIRADRLPPLEVIVADNGLDRRWAEAARCSGARVVAMGGNCGFARAVNRAAAESEGEILVVINDDISPTPRFVERLAAPIEDGNEMAAGVLVRSERPELIESAGVEIDAALAGYDYLQNEPLAVLDQPLAAPLGPCGGAEIGRAHV